MTLPSVPTRTASRAEVDAALVEVGGRLDTLEAGGGGEGGPHTHTAAGITNFDTAVDARAQLLINALVDAAPGVLNTLDELAAALGDNPAFAADMLTALAGKQPLHAVLTQLAAMTLANNTVVVRQAGVLNLITFAALKTALALDHGDLAGLGDDDHAQYYNQARGDARYVRPSQLATVGTTGAYADLTGKPSIPDSFDDLTGTVPTSALPALAINDVFPVSTQAEMLALTAQRGDVAIRSDISAAFILSTDSPATLADWKQLPVPAGAVISVNGQSGIVVLAKGDIGLGSVSNLAPADLPVSTATQSALDTKQALDADLTAIAALAPADDAVIQRKSSAWTSRTMSQLKTDLGLVKADVGLGGVDNTSDAGKPVSTAQQAALDLKQNLDADLTAIAALAPADDAVIQRKSSAWTSRTIAQLKTDLGVSNVDNTSDANKPVSTATQAALDLKQAADADLTAIAGLTPNNDDVVQRKAGAWTARSTAQLKADLAISYSDVSGTVPTAALPPLAINETFVVADQTAMLALTAQRGDMAIRSDNGRTYALSTDSPTTLADWKEVLAAGQVQSVAGKTGVVSLVKADVGLSSVDNTSDAGKPVSTAQQAALDTKQALDADLTAIAALAPSANDVLQYISTAWTNRTPAQVKTSLSLTKSDVGLSSVDNTSDTGKPVSTAQQAALDLKQTLDSDLTAIAALAPGNDDVIQRKSGAWTNRTLAQYLTDLALDVSKISGLQGALDAKAALASPTFTGTLTAPRIIRPPVALTDAATIATNAALGNRFRVTLAGNRTLGAPTNPTDGQEAIWEFIQDATGSRTITLDTGTGGFVLGTDITSVTLTTTASKHDFIGAIYNSTMNKWCVVSVVKGF